MKKRRLISTFLSLAMLLSILTPMVSTPALASDITENEVLTVQSIGHGEFRITQNLLSDPGESDNGVIHLSPVSGRNGFYTDNDENFYLKCTESALLQVDEVPIDVSSMENINEVIEEYGLSDIMAEDLRDFYINVSEARQVDSNIPYPEVYLYTARDSSIDAYSTTPKEPRYYSYNGHNLRDDVFYTVYVTPFRDYAFEGRTTASKLKNITDVTLYVVGAVSEAGSVLANVSLVGAGASLVYGLLQGWVDEFGASRINAKDGDWVQFSIDYNSNTKYTSVENTQGNYATCAKTGDVFVNSHGVNAFINNCRNESWYEVNEYVYTPNYPNPAPKAIASSTGGIWIEEIEYRTSGGYVFCPNDV